MRSTRWVVMLSAVLVAGPVFGEDAKKRDSSSSDRVSSAGSRHHSDSSGSSARSNGSGRASSNDNHGSRGDSGRASSNDNHGPRGDSGRASSNDNRGSRGDSDRASSNDNRGSRGGAARSETLSGAESRHPRPGTGSGYRNGRNGYGNSGSYYGGYSSYYNRPYYYRPYYYGYYGVPYYGLGLGYSSAYGFDEGYGDGYGYRAPYYRSSYGGYYRYRETGSIRTIVDPDKTKVYVDGYYAGTVDDFDGMFQRLYVAPGRHEVTLKLEGYRSHRFKVYVTEDSTVKIRHNMERGTGDETLSDLTDGREEPPYRLSQDEEGRDRYSRPYDDRAEPNRDRDRDEDARPARPEEERLPDQRDAGTLRVDVRPDDASVYVDGQFFGTGRRAGSIPLPPGRHRIEAVRPGFRTVERDVEIRAGKTESLGIELVRN